MRTTLILTALIACSPFHSFSQTNEYTFKWAKQFAGKNETTSGGIALDRAGNIYVTGRTDYKHYQSIGTHGWHHYGGKVFVAKMDASGKLLWEQKAGGGREDHATGTGVAVDNAGNIYVVGTFSGSIHFDKTNLKARGYGDIMLAKYDPSGKLLWIKQAGGKECVCQSCGISLDPNGDIFITGDFTGTVSFGNEAMTSHSGADPDYASDVFLAKYDSSGNVLWTRQAGDTGRNMGYGIATDVAGNIYVTGRFVDGSVQNFSITFDKIKIVEGTENVLNNFIVKYSNDGKVLWAKATAGGNFYGTQNSIAINKMGHLYLAGSFKFSSSVDGLTLANPNGNDEIFLLKYDLSGNLLWGRTAGGQAHDNCSGVAADESGNAFIVGYFSEDAHFGPVEVKAKPHEPETSYSPAFVAKYAPNGDIQWVKNVDVGRWFTPIDAVAMDANGNAYVTGSFFTPMHFDSITLDPVKNLFGVPIGGVFVAKLGR